MAVSPSGPGKSSARLLHDLLIFDPIKVDKNSRSVLTDHPPQPGQQPYTSRQDACKHDLITKTDQSILPPLDVRPDESSSYKLATVCKKCRLHVDLAIDYSQSQNPCPNSACPLHHFQRSPSQDRSQTSYLRYAWQCSSSTCRAFLTVTYKPQRLRQEHVALLTDTGRLKQRYEDILREDPTREGIKQTTPVEALGRLRKYIKDALNPDHTKRVFPANNKRFMEAFGIHGRDCAHLLQEIGFVYNEADVTWTLPQPQLADTRQINDPELRAFDVQDVEVELFALIDKVARESGQPNPTATESSLPAVKDLERVLAAQGYPRHAASRRTIISQEQESRFASLGALPDFADSLVLFCYQRQALCDVDEQSYYLECLQDIAAARNSEELNIEVTVLESQGQFSKRDLLEAYNAFNLPFGGGGADDERIMNLYQAQSSDLGPEASERARNMLWRIGNARGSRLLINASQQTIETMEEALAWLGNGVDKTTADDMILTVFSLRTDGDPAKEEIGRKAVTVIAKARQSRQLHTWLETGRTDGYTMSTDEALRHLDITQDLDTVDETLWPSIFENARFSRPGVQTDKAIAAIQQALAGAATSSHSTSSWPVGLTSLGNTCYLNSLLQYYFSLRPLREIVLNYDQFKFDLDLAMEKTERVGQRQISALEIKGGQKFAEDLRHLFQRMIRDPSSAVKPEQDLVCRAFLDPKDSDLWDNKGKIGDEHVLEDVKDDQNHEATTADQLPVTSSHPVDAMIIDAPKDDNKTTELPLTPPASPPGPDSAETVATAPPLPPRRFSTTTNAALERAQSNATQQQDVTEVHDGIQFRLRAGMRPQGRNASGEQIDELLELFSIQLLDTAVKDGVALKPQPLIDSAIQLNVLNEPTDIYSALDAVFDLQPVDGSEHLERYKSIASLPPFLQINIPRVGFDKEKGEQFKSEHSIRLVDELFMDRYTVGKGNDILDRRRRAWGWRRTLADLKKEHGILQATSNGVDGPSAVAETADYLRGLEDANQDLQELGIDGVSLDPSLPTALQENAEKQGVRLQELTSQITNLQARLSDLFVSFQEVKYRLQAVFFHRGKTAHGHYWICIKDFSNGMHWRRYNDERVEEISANKLNEIFEANDWVHGTPTYAVYVRDDLKTELVQPVCREPEGDNIPASIQSTEDPAIVTISAASSVTMGTGDERAGGTEHNTVTPSQKTLLESSASWDGPRTLPEDSRW